MKRKETHTSARRPGAALTILKRYTHTHALTTTAENILPFNSETLYEPYIACIRSCVVFPLGFGEQERAIGAAANDYFYCRLLNRLFFN